MKYCAVERISHSWPAVVTDVAKVIKSDTAENEYFLERYRMIYLGLNILRVFYLLTHGYMLIKDWYDCRTESEARFPGYVLGY